MSMPADPYLLVAGTFSHLLLERSQAVPGCCLHSGLDLVSDRSSWTTMAETVGLILPEKALAAGMVSGRVGELERSSPDPRAWSLQLEACAAGKARPLGPGKGPS